MRGDELNRYRASTSPLEDRLDHFLLIDGVVTAVLMFALIYFSAHVAAWWLHAHGQLLPAPRARATAPCVPSAQRSPAQHDVKQKVRTFILATVPQVRLLDHSGELEQSARFARSRTLGMPSRLCQNLTLPS